MRATDPIRVMRVGPLVVAKWADWQWSYDIPQPDRDSLARLCRYAPEALTPADYRALAALCEQERHLAAHPTGTEVLIRQLRCVRRGFADLHVR